VGGVQGDAIRLLYGRAERVLITAASGALAGDTANGGGANTFPLSTLLNMFFDSSRVHPTAQDVRPESLSENYFLRYA